MTAPRELGATVKTPLGEGTIVRVMDNAYIVHLRGFGNMPLQVKKDQVELPESLRQPAATVPPPAAESVQTQPVPSVPPTPPANPDSGSIGRTDVPAPSSASPREADAVKSGDRPPANGETRDGARRAPTLRSLEALRFGLVPESGLRELTLGYDALESWVLSRLPDGDGKRTVSEIYGPFGTGKSHTMAVIRHVAVANGYVVAHVEVNGREISLSQPDRLLGYLWSSLQATGLSSTGPMLDLYLKAASKGCRGYDIGSGRLDRIRDNYQIVRQLKESDVLDFISDEVESVIACTGEFTASQAMSAVRQHCAYLSTSMKATVGRLVEERAEDFVASLVGTALICKFAGYRGLVVTVDEFEVEWWANRDRIEDLINTLCRYLRGTLKFPLCPIALFFATTGEDDHEGDALINRLIEAGQGEKYPLKPWSKRQRGKLAQAIHDHYCRSYDSSLPVDPLLAAEVDKTIEETGDGDSGLIRAFIKRYVARLDQRFGPPSQHDTTGQIQC